MKNKSLMDFFLNKTKHLKLIFSNKDFEIMKVFGSSMFRELNEEKWTYNILDTLFSSRLNLLGF